MERLKGETGASPALSRNCKPVKTAQARSPTQYGVLHISRKGGGRPSAAIIPLQAWISNLPVHKRQGFLFFVNSSHKSNQRQLSMKRLTFYFVLFTTLSLLLAACSPAASEALAAPATPTTAPSSAPLSFTDGLKRTVTLSAPAVRIISLAPSNTEILFAIGAAEQMVGRDTFSDYPAEAKNLADIGGSNGKYDFEKIATLKPDLVIASELNTPDQVKALEDLHITVYYLSNPSDLEGMYANLVLVGEMTGHKAQSETLVASLRQRVKAVQDKVAEVTNRPTIFYELDATDPSKPFTAGPTTFIDQMIQLSGGTNIAGGLPNPWPQISLEEILVKNPDMILLGDAAYGNSPEQVKQRPGWTDLKAVKDGNIQVFDDNLVSRPGPRLIDGLEILVKLIHPELYK
jgi:iron complex transport system substrate-binding protein